MNEFLDAASGSHDGPGPGLGLGRVRVRTLTLTRWLAVAGQTVALLFVSEILAAPVEMAPAMVVVGVSVCLNIVIQFRGGLAGWHSERTAAGLLGYDIVQLASLLFLTGGLANPFALLVLAPVTVSATVLSLRSTLYLGVLAAFCLSVIGYVHAPLPWPGPPPETPALLTLAIWVSLNLCMAFLVFYTWRVGQEARRFADALSATQLSLAREQELSSLGSLAAAAAHELGTPLGTITLIAREISEDLPPEGQAQEDITLLRSEAERCRRILAQLSNYRSSDHYQEYQRLSISALTMAAAEPHRRKGIAIDVREGNSTTGAAPWVRRRAELLHGLGNFIENAADFAAYQVRIEITWDDQTIRISIQDDGPGFAPKVLGILGEPYISTRSGDGGLGLGVFISKTLLERTGATVSFGNASGGAGAVVTVSWRRTDLEDASEHSAEVEDI